jgi:hypothetical protein
LRPSPPCFGTASLWIHKFARPQRWPLLSNKQQLDSSYTHLSLPHRPWSSYVERNHSRNGRKVSIDGDAPFLKDDLAFFCSTTQKNLPHTLRCFQNCNYWGICKSIISKFLQWEFVMSIICKSNYDDVSFHLEYWIAIVGQRKKKWWLQFAIAGANSAIAIAGVIECVLHNTLQELSGREGHCRRP